MIDDKAPRQGYVHVYTGNGKGKSTAALGLALRAAGAGLRVFIGQFVKGQRYSEHDALERFSDLITVRQYGRECFIRRKPDADDVAHARSGIDHARQVVQSKEYDVVILDEANVAVFFHLIPAETIVDIIRTRPSEVDLIITGRYADDSVIESADLVTEMREVKHYYSEGVLARRGIEM